MGDKHFAPSELEFLMLAGFYKHFAPNGARTYAFASSSSKAVTHRSHTVGNFDDSFTRVE